MSAHTPKCAECRNGEIDQAATCAVSHPNPDHKGLWVTKWVCDEHFTMLSNDYGADLHTVRAAIRKATEAKD